MTTLAEIQARDIRDSHHEMDGTLEFVEALRDRSDLLSMLKAETERADRATAEAAVLYAFADKVRDMTTGGTWKEMLDNDIELMKEANRLCEDSTLAAAHLALHRRLVEGQRTSGTVELCRQCEMPADDCILECQSALKVMTDGGCPIRAVVKP